MQQLLLLLLWLMRPPCPELLLGLVVEPCHDTKQTQETALFFAHQLTGAHATAANRHMTGQLQVATALRCLAV